MKEFFRPSMRPSGGESFIKWSQLYSLFQINQLSYDDMAEQFASSGQRGREDFREFLRNRRRAQLQDEQLAVGLRQKAMKERDRKAEADWINIATSSFTRQLEADKTLIIQGLVFTEPGSSEKANVLPIQRKALDNVRSSVEAEGVQADASN